MSHDLQGKLILGITDGINCGAALLRDGMVLAAVNEERLCRLKMAFGFPRDSIVEVLRIANVGPHEVDQVAVATMRNYFFDGVRPFDGWLRQDKGLLRNTVFSAAGRLGTLVNRIPGLESLYYGLRQPVFVSRRRAIPRILASELAIPASVEFVDHHLAHAASAYFTSGFENSLVVTSDGGGDGASGHVYDVRDGTFQRLHATSAYNSLANYYSYVTSLCGFHAQKHEGKITGLAAHGEPRYLDLLDARMTLRDGRLRNVGGRVFAGAVEELKRSLPDGWQHADLAASIQQHCEELTLSHIAQFLDPDTPRDVALAGGLFANVRINQRILELPGVKRVFVHPGMTDAGLSVGAALTLHCREREQCYPLAHRDVIRDVFYGPDYGEHEIEKALATSGLEYDRVENLEAEVARLLADGRVVARFDGRMEYGPRALGNRSILCHPGDPTVNDWLNERLGRTEFMPFAPATPLEESDRFYHDTQGGCDTARFMTITFDCTPWMKETCRGVVHVDGTARPQLVDRECMPGYHKIITEFGRLTGIPTVINTSFNMHEEPIVCTPDDAVRAFQRGHLDYLAIGRFLAKAPQAMERDPVEVARVRLDAG